MKNVAGASGGGEDKKLKKNIEYIHVYAKDYTNLEPFTAVHEYIQPKLHLASPDQKLRNSAAIQFR